MEITFELVHLLNLDSGPTNYCDWVEFRKEDWRKVTPAVEDNKDKEWNHDDCRYNEKIFFVFIHFLKSAYFTIFLPQ